MDKYELFLEELTTLCRKHEIEIGVDSNKLFLSNPRRWDNLRVDTILNRSYRITDSNFRYFSYKQ